MLINTTHLSDQDILLVLDGELPRRRATHARAHLTACWQCRSRLSAMEGMIEEFVSLQQHSLDTQLPPDDGGLAVFKARLGQAAATTPHRAWHRFFEVLSSHRAVSSVAAVVLITLAGAKLLSKNVVAHAPASQAGLFATAPVPDHSLTPGATRPISLSDVCSRPHEEVVRDVPSGLRQQVFKEYGIVGARPGDYEIDYLIAPGLGGTEDIHNLWPEPSNNSAWNAHVKDALEERLHTLVCDGKVDLPTAQQAIASDWITAYKKYFGSEKYLSRLSPASLQSAEQL